MLRAAPCQAGHSIADALSRQKGKKAQVLASAAASAGQTHGDVATQRKSAATQGALQSSLTLISDEDCFLYHQQPCASGVCTCPTHAKVYVNHITGEHTICRIAHVQLLG